MPPERVDAPPNGGGGYEFEDHKYFVSFYGTPWFLDLSDPEFTPNKNFPRVPCGF